MENMDTKKYKFKCKIQILKFQSVKSKDIQNFNGMFSYCFSPIFFCFKKQFFIFETKKLV